MLENNISYNQHSLELFAHQKHLNDFVSLYEKSLFPSALLLSGKKGIGKHTLVNHFLNYIFNKDTETPYDLKNQIINKDSTFNRFLINNLCSNIIYLNAGSTEGVKIDQIRKLKQVLSKTTLDSKPRFIIFNEAEKLNLNCANALLKILEEPTKKNYFILIDNNQSKIVETVTSRCIKYNIFLSPVSRNKIIEFFLSSSSFKSTIKHEINTLTPGLFLEFNEILNQNNITSDTVIFESISALLKVYKKSKNLIIINLCSFLVEQHFHKLIIQNSKNINTLISLKNNIIKNFKNLVEFNLNVTSVLNSIEIKLKNV